MNRLVVSRWQPRAVAVLYCDSWARYCYRGAVDARSLSMEHEVVEVSRHDVDSLRAAVVDSAICRFGSAAPLRDLLLWVHRWGRRPEEFRLLAPGSRLPAEVSALGYSESWIASHTYRSFMRVVGELAEEAERLNGLKAAAVEFAAVYAPDY